MVLDTLTQGERYISLHPALPRAFDFIVTRNIAALAPGRHEIDGDLLYLTIAHNEGRGRTHARLESHRRFIDIQVTLDGDEEIGWRPVARCGVPAGAYDESRDISFYQDQPETWLSVPRGSFAIFFPSDAHAPLSGRGLLKKAIVKVAI